MIFTNQERMYSKLPDGSDIVNVEPTITGIRASSTGEVMDFPVERADIFIGDSCLVSVGTNGFQGGDAGHGSRTYIRLVVPPSYNFSTNRKYNHQDQTTTLEIVGAGDWELQTIVEGLRFILNSLEDQIQST